MSWRPTVNRRAPTGACVAALCLACSPAESPPAVEFPHAYVYADCAPWDGPALSIVLTHDEVAEPFEVGYPNLRITSYRPPAELAGSSFEWSGDAFDLGQAFWCDTAESCRPATIVRVDFDRTQSSADVVVGTLRVELEGREVVVGAFEAERLTFPMLCG